MNFEAGMPALLAYRWKFTYLLINKLTEKFPNRIYNLKYEDLCEEPEKFSREICDFLNNEFQDKMLDFHKTATSTEKLLQEKSRNIHKNLKNPINTSRIGLWKKRLEEKQIMAADMVVGSLAEKAGYTRNYTRFNILFRIKHQPVVLYGKLIFWIMRNMQIFPPFLRKLLQRIVSQFIRIYNTLSGKKNRKNESR